MKSWELFLDYAKLANCNLLNQQLSFDDIGSAMAHDNMKLMDGPET